MIKIIREKYKKYLAVRILVVITVVLSSIVIMLPILKLAEQFGVNIKGNTGLNFKVSVGNIFFFFLFGVCSIAIIWLAQKYIHQKPFSQLGFKSKFWRDMFFGFLLGVLIVAVKNIIYGLNAEIVEYNPIAIPDNISTITYIRHYTS